MKNNETAFRHSRAPKAARQSIRKKPTAGPELHQKSELGARAERRKLASEERRLRRRELRRARRVQNALPEPPPEPASQ